MQTKKRGNDFIIKTNTKEPSKQSHPLSKTNINKGLLENRPDNETETPAESPAENLTASQTCSPVNEQEVLLKNPAAEKLELIEERVTEIKEKNPILTLTFCDPEHESFNNTIVKLTPTHINDLKAKTPSQFSFGIDLDEEKNDFNFEKCQKENLQFSINYRESISKN